MKMQVYFNTYCLVYKVYKKIMFNRVYSYFEKFLCFMIDNSDSETNITKKKKVFSFFLDLRKAFDIIDHKMIRKLECYCIRAEVLKWFTSYLEHRVQRVKLNGVMSGWEKLKWCTAGIYSWSSFIHYLHQ